MLVRVKRVPLKKRYLIVFFGRVVFVFTNFVCSKQKTFALRSLALEPDKAPLCGSHPLVWNLKSPDFQGFLNSEKGGFEPPVELLPHNLSKIAP